MRNSGLPEKKSFTYYEKSEERRAEYNARIKRVPQEKRIYVDESGVHSHIQREYARAMRGEPIEDVKRGQRFERTNVVGALLEGEHYAVECYSRATDANFFEGWFANNLLKEIPEGEGYTVIMDNAKFHRKKILRKLARGKVRLLFLPPYSPDYNPIEKSWANMKRHIRDSIQNFQSVAYAIYDYFGFQVVN